MSYDNGGFRILRINKLFLYNVYTHRALRICVFFLSFSSVLKTKILVDVIYLYFRMNIQNTHNYFGYTIFIA